MAGKFKKIIFAALLGSMLWSCIPGEVVAISQDLRHEIGAQDIAFRNEAGFEAGASIAKTIKAAISGFLGLLAIIFIILMILAGYNWMTAGGEEQKVTKAKDTIQAAIIGLIIIVAAYAITFFVFKYLPFGAA